MAQVMMQARSPPLRLQGVAVSDDRFQREALLVVRALLRRAASLAQQRAFALGVKVAQLEVGVPGLYDPDAQAFIAQYEYRAIDNLTRKQAEKLRATLQDAVREGLDERERVRRLEQALGDREGSLQVIARTETNRAASWGRFTSWQQASKKERLHLRKEWIATHDERVREDHLEADGEIVELNAPFTRGAARGLLMPPAAPNCRCACAPVTHLRDLGLARAAFREEMPGLRAIEDAHIARMLTIWRGWARRAENGVEEHEVRTRREVRRG